jgi:hypothetical protein
MILKEKGIKLNKEKIIVISPPRINDVKYNFEASNSENECPIPSEKIVSLNKFINESFKISLKTKKPSV